MADLLFGNGIRETARKHGVPKSTVSRWNHHPELEEVRREAAKRIDFRPFRFGRK